MENKEKDVNVVAEVEPAQYSNHAEMESTGKDVNVAAEVEPAQYSSHLMDSVYGTCTPIDEWQVDDKAIQLEC